MDEFGLIRRIAALLPSPSPGAVGIGDDTAVLPRPRGRLLATCDAVVEGVHFLRDDGPMADVGWKALAVNLSDVAAMGGRPRWALVSLGLPPDLDEPAVLDLYRGLAELARLAGVHVVGGNVTRAPALWVDVALLAEAPAAPPLRSGAAPGHAVLVTGHLGAAAAGLALLRWRRQRGGLPPGLDPAAAEAAVAAQRRPQPRLAAGQALVEAGLAAAMIDVSDGLAADLGHVAEASGVAIELDLGALPVSPAARAVAACLGENAVAWALSGGEDYELAFTVPGERAAEAAARVEALGVPCRVVGRVVAGSGLWCVDEAAGTREPLPARGWDHLRPA